jgi:hypothetical protein
MIEQSADAKASVKLRYGMIDGVKFINKCVESSAKGAVWVDY